MAAATTRTARFIRHPPLQISARRFFAPTSVGYGGRTSATKTGNASDINIFPSHPLLVGHALEQYEPAGAGVRKSSGRTGSQLSVAVPANPNLFLAPSLLFIVASGTP